MKIQLLKMSQVAYTAARHGGRATASGSLASASFGTVAPQTHSLKDAKVADVFRNATDQINLASTNCVFSPALFGVSQSLLRLLLC